MPIRTTNIAPIQTSIAGPTGTGALANPTGRGFIVLLGKATPIALGTNQVNNLFLTPAAGFTRMVVTDLVLDNFSTGIALTTNTVSFGTNAGSQIDWLPVTTLTGTVATTSVIYFTAPINTVKATWAPVNQVQLAVGGAGAAVNCDVSVFGYYT